MEQSARRHVSGNSPSPASAVPLDHQISYKKPVKIRNELNEKRRNALKEYYKLKQQQQNLQKETESLLKNSAVIDNDHEVDLETEILEDRPIKEIDLVDSDFKDIVTNTNRLTSSINLINSSIKNIIYNNYYELIKLNQFLENLNGLDLSIVDNNENGANDGNESQSTVNILDKLSLNAKESTQKDNESTNLDQVGHGLDKLNELMDKIEELDKKDYKSAEITAKNSENVQLITSLLGLKELKDDHQKPKLNNQLTKVIADLKDANGSALLIKQLQDLQKVVT